MGFCKWQCRKKRALHSQSNRPRLLQWPFLEEFCAAGRRRKEPPTALGKGWGSTTNRSQGWTRHCVPELQIRVCIKGRRGRNRVIHLVLLGPKLLCLLPLSYSFWLAITSESNKEKSKQIITCLLLQILWPPLETHTSGYPSHQHLL